MNKEVIDLEAREVTGNGREVWRPVVRKRGDRMLCATWLLGLLAVTGGGAFGLISSQAVMAGLLAGSVAGGLLMKRLGSFSQIYLAAVAIGVVGMVLVVCLPGSWAVIGAPFCAIAMLLMRKLEVKGWAHA